MVLVVRQGFAELSMVLVCRLSSYSYSHPACCYHSDRCYHHKRLLFIVGPLSSLISGVIPASTYSATYYQHYYIQLQVRLLRFRSIDAPAV